MLFVIIGICLNIILAILVLLITVYTIYSLQIRLSLSQRMGYYVNVIGLFMRIFLSIDQLISENYVRNTWKIYFKWFEDLFFFCFYLNGFGRVIASWFITKELKKESNKNLDINQVFSLAMIEEKSRQMVKRVSNLNRLITIGLVCFFVLSLAITVQDASITKGVLDKVPNPRWQYWNLFSIFILFSIL